MELIDYLICLSVGREILEFRDKVLVGAQKTKQMKKIKTKQKAVEVNKCAHEPQTAQLLQNICRDFRM